MEKREVGKKSTRTIPVIIENHENAAKKTKLMIPSNYTAGHLVNILRSRMHVLPYHPVYLFLKSKQSPVLMSKSIGQLYRKHRDEKGLLRLIHAGQASFGFRGNIRAIRFRQKWIENLHNTLPQDANGPQSHSGMPPPFFPLEPPSAANFGGPLDIDDFNDYSLESPMAEEIYNDFLASTYSGINYSPTISNTTGSSQSSGFANSSQSSTFTNSSQSSTVPNSSQSSTFPNSSQSSMFPNSSLSSMFPNSSLSSMFLNSSLSSMFANSSQSSALTFSSHSSASTDWADPWLSSSLADPWLPSAATNSGQTSGTANSFLFSNEEEEINSMYMEMGQAVQNFHNVAPEMSGSSSVPAIPNISANVQPPNAPNSQLPPHNLSLYESDSDFYDSDKDLDMDDDE